MAFFKFFAGAAVARFVGFYFGLIADEGGVSCGFGAGYFGTGHGAGEGHAGGLAAGAAGGLGTSRLKALLRD